MSIEQFASPMNLVSIICRTIGRPELKQALESALNQSYPAIEIIVVNASKADLSRANVGQASIIVLSPGNLLSRAEAANSGLDAANGDYIMFLDDDDWISSDHVQNLVTALKTNVDVKAAYASTQKMTHEGLPLPHVFDTEFDPYLLMRDNYIPIHAVLFEKNLVKQGCRFDNTFEIYEDWDFWLQLSRHTDFKHIHNITAFYRVGGDSGTDIKDDAIRFNPNSKFGKARAHIYDKWRKKWNGNQINLLLGNILKHHLSKDLQQLKTRFKKELIKTAKLSDEITAINEKTTELETRNLKLKRRLDSASKIIDEKDKYTKAIESNLTQKIDVEKHLQLHVNQLEHAYEAVIRSRTWRLLGPLRRTGRFLKAFVKKLIPTIETKLLIKEQNFSMDSQQKPQLIMDNKVSANPRKAIDPKIIYSNKAKEELSLFLSSDRNLVFTQSKFPKVSIVIVFYNQPHLGLLCLQSILTKAEVSHELIIIDNASDKETDALLDRIRNAKIIRNQMNLGFIKAVNQGAEAARGKFILLLNNDALIEKDTLSNALKSMSEKDDIGAVGGKIKLIDGTLQEAGSIIWRDGSTQGYGRGQDPCAPAFMFKREVDYCSGAFLLFRKTQFIDLSGFDLDYSPAYYEETDFCIRLQKKGLKIIYDPSVRITHYEFGSSEGYKEASVLQEKNREILREKHKDWLSEKYQADPQNLLSARTSNNFTNVLFIDDRVPHISLGSGYPRSAHLLNTLSKFKLNVTFYPLQFPIDDWHAAYRTLNNNIEIILNEGRAGLEDFLKDRKGYFSHIIISRAHNMAFFKSVIEKSDRLITRENIIYDAEALTANREIMRMKLQNQSLTESEEKELVEEEINHARIANSVIAVSKQEAGIYQANGIENVHVLGHAVEPNPGENTFREREGLLFVGALRDEGSPNVDSLLWFVVNVLPLIEIQIPSINLYVVGELGAASLFTINKRNVVFKGRLESINEIYNNCRVFIAPTRFAAGIPHKIHEAASAGIPSVTTELLSKQLRWKNGEEILVGTNAAEFAQQCVRLYKESRTWAKIREGGLEAVYKDCSDFTFKKTLKLLVS
ncbi:MAG: glycosyltransferase [Gammaproteobacteria bacterium]|nr:glycosyltransferase [Gammaproteobacteria bacterium]